MKPQERDPADAAGGNSRNRKAFRLRLALAQTKDGRKPSEMSFAQLMQQLKEADR